MRAPLQCVTLWAVMAMALLACSPEPEAPQDQSMRLILQQPITCQEVVASVNGHPICSETVRAMLQRPGNQRNREQILQDLIMGELGVEQALAKGYAETPGVQQLHQRLMVQEWRRVDIEEALSPSNISAEAVKRYYEENYFFYKDPDLRDADHLLVRPSPEKWKKFKGIPPEVFEEARVFATRIHKDIVSRGEVVKNHKDFERIKERWDAKRPENLEILVEKLPPAPRKEFGVYGKPGFIPALVDEFASVLFSLEVGELSKPVSTVFGTHIMVLEDILPATSVPLSQAEPGIREHLSSHDKKTRFISTLRDLNKTSILQFNDKLWEEQVKGGSASNAAPKTP